MTSTGHALIGALIAAKFQNPAVALPIAFLSHFPMDFLPHWDVGTHITKKSKPRIIIEGALDVLGGLVGGIILYTILSQNENYILLIVTIFTAQLPDWMAAPYFILNWKFPLFKWIDDFQEIFHRKLDKPWGIVTQIGAVVVLYIVLFVLF